MAPRAQRQRSLCPFIFTNTQARIAAARRGLSKSPVTIATQPLAARSQCPESSPTAQTHRLVRANYIV